MQLPFATSVEELMGLEGNIRQIYYEGFDLIINDFEMGTRTKQPPQNEVNALISFGNMMCYSQCLRAIHQTQLNPTISYLHSPGERRYSLSLDISEIFKPILVDRVIFKLLNRRELQERHFESKLNRCLLNPSGKKIFVKAFDDRLNETIQHRSLKRKVSYKHLIKLSVTNLASICWEWKSINLLKCGGKVMYVILVYDCGEKRVGKMLKLCRKYLNWIQNSVFEGEISEVKLKELSLRAEKIMDLENDSLIIFSSRSEKWLDKQIIGKERSSIDNFL